MHKVILLALIAMTATAGLFAQEVPAKKIYMHAGAGIGSGMYAALGGEYRATRYTGNFPIPVQLGGKAQAIYSPKTGSDYSLVGIGLMPTIRYEINAIPGLAVFTGVGFGFLYYLESETSYKTTIDFFTELGASYTLSDSVAAFAGFGAYWGDLSCFMAGVNIGL